MPILRQKAGVFERGCVKVRLGGENNFFDFLNFGDIVLEIGDSCRFCSNELKDYNRTRRGRIMEEHKKIIMNDMAT